MPFKSVGGFSLLRHTAREACELKRPDENGRPRRPRTRPRPVVRLPDCIVH